MGLTHRTPKQKFEAVQLYLMLGGNVAKTSRALNIPEQTFWTWKKTDWWHEYENQIRREENLALSARLQKAIGKSMDVLEDRLENGDWIYDQKTGKMIRKPVSLKDAERTVSTFIDKREKLQETQQLTVAAEQIDDKLKKLAEAFAKLSTPQIAVTDVVFVKDEDDISLEESTEDMGMSSGEEAGGAESERLET